jgi:glucose-1-phosphate thymidylyltransferase
MLKGVILAGGFGTRLRPFTKQLNKGLAPIYTPEGAIPQLMFPLNTLIKSGITEILIITSRDHCGQIVELFGDGSEYGCNLTYKIQEMDRPVVGIAQALGLSKEFVGSSKFSVILGDNYYKDTFTMEFNDFEKNVFIKSCIFLKEVDDPQRFGVATIKDDIVTKIVEKPKVPESNFAVSGLYLYTPEVFDIVKTLKPSARSELEITDVNNYFVNNGTMGCYNIKSDWCDMGLPSSAKRVCDLFW